MWISWTGHDKWEGPFNNIQSTDIASCTTGKTMSNTFRTAHEWSKTYQLPLLTYWQELNYILKSNLNSVLNDAQHRITCKEPYHWHVQLSWGWHPYQGQVQMENPKWQVLGFRAPSAWNSAVWSASWSTGCTEVLLRSRQVLPATLLKIMLCNWCWFTRTGSRFQQCSHGLLTHPCSVKGFLLHWQEKNE